MIVRLPGTVTVTVTVDLEPEELLEEVTPEELFELEELEEVVDDEDERLDVVVMWVVVEVEDRPSKIA